VGVFKRIVFKKAEFLKNSIHHSRKQKPRFIQQPDNEWQERRAAEENCDFVDDVFWFFRAGHSFKKHQNP
jgi:hypothetical protein